MIHYTVHGIELAKVLAINTYYRYGLSFLLLRTYRWSLLLISKGTVPQASAEKILLCI